MKATRPLLWKLPGNLDEKSYVQAEGTKAAPGPGPPSLLHKQPLRLAPLSTSSGPVFCSLFDLYLNLVLSLPRPIYSHLSAEPPRQRAPRPPPTRLVPAVHAVHGRRVGVLLRVSRQQVASLFRGTDTHCLVPTSEPPLTDSSSPGFPLKEQKAKSDFLLTHEPTSLAADVVAGGPATPQGWPRAPRHCAQSRAAGWEGTQ